ncbi:CPBP family intramembrane glutamic endopeptidase [Plantibacter sp. CFBP 8775]|uniref:CPBP family intramembrane glutamic endopeptidase n=1 Tax=Plantibacter sp. CFBP 8775 TaxID=2774038 RepID=UPI0017861816|nr:CPBP family intramembrane glutamic endopeptidase [Plantibacter sp. CFBP 8775]MBD8104413.1 CPBP family intramembrane metalloprotease [Plantibacter sp. CFBP 8775]
MPPLPVSASAPAPSPEQGPPGDHHIASWRVRAPWLAAIAFALVPVVFTAGASTAAQLSGASEAGAALTLAAGAAVSAILGLVVMRLSPPRVRDYGFRRPRRARAALWFVPAAATVLIIPSQGIRVDAPTIAAYGVLVVAVALNEETWFRAIVFAILRARSTRTAVVGSSVLFGVLHLANLAGGADVGSSILQVAFAALFGFVAAQLLVLTGSLWPAIAWHATWNFVSFIGGDSTDDRSLIGLGAACVVMLGYAVFLGRRTSSRPDGAATIDAPALP